MAAPARCTGSGGRPGRSCWPRMPPRSREKQDHFSGRMKILTVDKRGAGVELSTRRWLPHRSLNIAVGFYSKQVMSLNGLRLVSKVSLEPEDFTFGRRVCGTEVLLQCICLPAWQCQFRHSHSEALCPELRELRRVAFGTRPRGFPGTVSRLRPHGSAPGGVEGPGTLRAG